MPDVPTSGMDPRVWAEAAGMLAKNPAFYVFIGLIIIFIVCKWPPWRGRKVSE